MEFEADFCSARSAIAFLRTAIWLAATLEGGLQVKITKRSLSLFVGVVICAVTSLTAADNLLLSVTGTCTGDILLGAYDDNPGTNWSQTVTYSNVSIAVTLSALPYNLGYDGTPVLAFLTNQAGSGTTAANQIAISSLVIPLGTIHTSMVVLSGLTLGPGKYYLSLTGQSQAIGSGAWCGSSHSAVSTGTGVAELGDFFLYPSPSGYPPGQPYHTQPSGSASLEVSITGTPGTTSPPPPSIASGGVVPVAGSTPIIQVGEWASIFGANLASGTTTWTGNFPTSLGGTSVTINGQAAYLSFVSPGQINFQVPNVTATGSVPVMVTTAAGSATSTVTLAQFSPTFFLLDTKHVAGIILRSNGSGAYGGGSYDIIGPTGTSLGYQTVAAKVGDVIELYGTGLGPTNPAVAAGQVFVGAAPSTNPVALRINNASVITTFTGLSGAGLYQINLVVPSGLGTGDVSLQASVSGISTPSGVVISLQ